MMMGASLTCAACHGPDGKGGVHWMHMLVMEAPDIRYSALNSEAEEHEGEGHTGEAFDLEDFRRAVIQGEHPDGEALSTDMPRWRMSDEDLADLFAYLKLLGE
jgi:mono/diheme cytochrome c family protein